MERNTNFCVANLGARVEENTEYHPIIGTERQLVGEIPSSSEKSEDQTRQITVNLSDGGTKHVVRGGIHSSVLSGLRSIKAISDKIDNMKKKNKEPFLIGKEGIEGCINLGMPLKYLPQDSHLEMKFYKVEKNETAGIYRQYNDGKDCILFYICPNGNRLETSGAQSRRIISCKELLKERCDLCVFSPNGETIKDALCKDGRFLDDLTKKEWVLMDHEKSWGNSLTVEKNISNKRFEVELKTERGIKGTGGPRKDQNLLANYDVKTESLAKTCDGLNKEQFLHPFQEVKTKSQVTTFLKKEQAHLTSLEEYQKTFKILSSSLLQEYPCLVEQSKVISDFFKTKAQQKPQKDFLLARREEFGKVTKNSILIKMQRILTARSESVGYIVWGTHAKEGSATCFVFCNKYILTCRHVVNLIVGEGTDEKEWAYKISQSAYVIFSYEGRHPKDSDSFSLEQWFEISDKRLDFAVLKLKENGKRVPAGLVQFSSPSPFDGLIYIIGHPGDEAKSVDGCSVVSLLVREQTCVWRFQQLEERNVNCNNEDSITCIHMFTPRSFLKIINNPDVVTYDTSFFHGSSGSPVFDRNGNLVALHTAGYLYQCKDMERSVIEYGFSMSSILLVIKKEHKLWYDSEIAPYLNCSDVEMQDLDQNSHDPSSYPVPH
ncbi:LOW QUALITY PROTEIN: serine protease FAM111A-like [Eublepharis macularius]|uniref:LOW QUALITY PROTEIN: serine protease FAM111A-like n=1 Tax=Eublepharis macularius TaxID=481883 RepID=A0AA97KPN9_EUBMA|nr:LOW QUALITY PROTEIN: serine protease FAM111A-like [Eublepharis macularius]